MTFFDDFFGDGGGGGGDSAAAIYEYFTAEGRAEVFRATGYATPDDVSLTINPTELSQGSIDAIVEAVAPTDPRGPGGIPVTLPPVLLGNNPVDGVAVWITTEVDGSNLIAGTLYTNTFGLTDPFMLEPGFYFVWVQKAGINFPTPKKLEVLENGTYRWATS